MKLCALLALLALTGCIRPEINVCSTPESCVIHACDSAGACNAEPLELKGAL